MTTIATCSTTASEQSIAFGFHRDFVERPVSLPVGKGTSVTRSIPPSKDGHDCDRQCAASGGDAGEEQLLWLPPGRAGRPKEMIEYQGN
jgi:hypothetical protein